MNMKPKFNSPRMPPGLPAWLAKAWMNDELEFDAPVPPPVKKCSREVVPPSPHPSSRERFRRSPAEQVEFRKWFNRARKNCSKLGSKIAKDFERERKRLLAETLKKQKEYDLELVLMAQEEKQAAAVKAYLEQCQREAAKYIEKLRGAAA